LQATPARAVRVPSFFERALVAANQWIVIALMGAMAVLVFANVVSRYVLNFSIVWVEEVTRYMMVWVGFLGSGLVLRLGAHIAVDTFQDRLPDAAARIVRAGIVLLLGATFAAMTWLGIRYVGFAWDQTTPILQWRMGYIYLAIPIGSALMLLHLALIAKRFVFDRTFEKDLRFAADEATP
jgi:TRAP-type C4-dicarboxylate transport system permease small subunit